MNGIIRKINQDNKHNQINSKTRSLRGVKCKFSTTGKIMLDKP